MHQSFSQGFFKKHHQWIYPSLVWGIQLCIALITVLMFTTIIHPHNQNYGYFSSWDGGWYLGIAIDGYHSIKSTVFLPLYPLLTHLTHAVTQLPITYAGAIVSNLALWLALLLLYRLILLNHPELIAKRCLWLITAFPAAFFFHCAYTESVTILTYVIFFYCLQRNHWYTAMACGFLSTVTHDINVLLVFPALASLWLKRYELPRATIIIRFFSIALIPLSLILYMGFLYHHFGNPFAFMSKGIGRHKHIVFPIVQIFPFIYHLLKHPNADPTYNIVMMINAVSTLIMIVMGLLMITTYRNQIPFEQKVLYIIMLIILTSIRPGISDLQSYARYMTVLFPGFIVWAYTCKREWLFLSSIMLMLPIQTILLGMFANWYWIT